MPIYEFQCPECNTKYERVCKVGETSYSCKSCGSVSQQIRLVSKFGFTFGVGTKLTDINQLDNYRGVPTYRPDDKK